MTQKCVLFLVGYDSPSGYFRLWETDGESSSVEYPYRGKQGPNWMSRISVYQGQHLFLHSKPDDDTPTFAKLVQVPLDEDGFRAFCEQADRVAGQRLYDQLLVHKHGPRFGAGRIQEDDFFGEWLEGYVVREWQEDDKKEEDGEEKNEIPITLSEALRA